MVVYPTVKNLDARWRHRQTDTRKAIRVLAVTSSLTGLLIILFYYIYFILLFILTK